MFTITIATHKPHHVFLILNFMPVTYIYIYIICLTTASAGFASYTMFSLDLIPTPWINMIGS